jgi:hypothetical protein
MQYFLTVHMVQSNADLDEEAPDPILAEKLVLSGIRRIFALLEQLVEVAVLAKLHYYIHLIAVRNE